MSLTLLAAIVALAFAVETSLGFGATILTVTLGATLLPIPELLPAFVPLNLALSVWLTAYGWRSLDRRLLFGTILPWMALGVPLGLLAFLRLDATWLARLLGVFVFVLAARELLHGAHVDRAPANRWASRAMLALGGVMHGAFGSGGPFVVWVLGRTDLDKAAFRATLAGLWLTLNIVLFTTYAADGRIGAESFSRTAILAGGAVVGLAVGEALFRRIPPARFRRFVFALLLVAGAILALPRPGAP